MNETIRLLQAHHSSRSYKADAIPEEILDAVIESARRAPTSTNSHEISLVVVRNAESRARIAEIAGGQPWIAQAPAFIAVIADFYKTGLGVKKAGGVQVFQRSLEGILAAVSDAGIAMATLMTATRAFGLGVVPIWRNPSRPAGHDRFASVASRHFSGGRSRAWIRCRRISQKAAHGHRELPSRGNISFRSA